MLSDSTRPQEKSPADRSGRAWLAELNLLPLAGCLLTGALLRGLLLRLATCL